MGEEVKTSTNWWLLYPFIGLEITDSNSGIGRPMFERFHVVAPNHIKGLARYYKTNAEADSPNLPQISLSEVQKWIEPIGIDCQSLILVKQCVKVEEDALERALPNANLFAAIVALSCFCKNFGIQYCALRENLPKLEKDEKRVGAGFSIEGKSMVIGHHSVLKNTPDIYYQMSPFKMSRRELKKLILSRDLGFGRILLLNEDSLKPFRNQLEFAIRTLDAAIRQRDKSLKLIGCITAVDTLFEHDGNTKFDRLKNRLKVVLNEPTTTWLQLDGIIDARHKYVHRGQPIESAELIQRAVHLAVMAVICYSNVARLFTNRKEMFAYLDAISLVKGVSNRPQGEVCIEMPKIGKRIRTEFSKLTKIGYTRNLIANDQLADYTMGRLEKHQEKSQ